MKRNVVSQNLDVYSNRLYSEDVYGIYGMQYSILRENLVRRYPNKVNTEMFLAVPKNIKDTDFISLFADLEKISLNHFGTLHTKCMFFEGESHVLKISIQRTHDDEDDDDDYTEMSFLDAKNNIYCLDCVIDFVHYVDVENLLKILRKFNFDITDNLHAGKGIPIVFASPSKHGVTYKTRSFDPILLDDIKVNYDSKVIEKINTLLVDMSSASHGLVLINGPVGTGKSYLIRSILTEMKNKGRRAIACLPPTQFFIEADLLTNVITQFRRSCFVFEDVGDLVSIEASSQYMDARSNLLNLTEGFLSLLADSIIIISFNYDISKIDPAIIRPGRCLAHIEVNNLSYDKVKDMIPFDILHREYSLAEVYEMRRLKKPIQSSHIKFGLKK